MYLTTRNYTRKSEKDNINTRTALRKQNSVFVCLHYFGKILDKKVSKILSFRIFKRSNYLKYSTKFVRSFKVLGFLYEANSS